MTTTNAAPNPDSGTTAPAGRRPLKTRDWKLFSWLAEQLAVNDISPNMISMFSVLYGVLAGASLAGTNLVDDSLSRRALWFTAAIFVQMRLIANLLDGMVAVEGGKASAVGELFNEVPDRVSDPAILCGLGFAWGGCPILGLTAAMASIFVAYTRAIGASVGVGQIFLGPFAKPQRMALVTIVCLFSACLPGSWLTIHSGSGLGLAGWSSGLLIVGCAITAVRRLLKIAHLMRERESIDNV